MDFLWLSVGECMCAHTFVTVEMFSGELTFLSLLEYVCACKVFLSTRLAFFCFSFFCREVGITLQIS